MIDITEDKILNVKNKPQFTNAIELKTIEDLQKLVDIGNLVCLYEDNKEKIFFIQNFFYREEKK